MRTRIAKFIIGPLLLASSLIGANPSQAQKIIDLGADTIRLEKSDTDREIEVRFSTGSDSGEVIVRRVPRAESDGQAEIVKMGENITIEADQIIDGDVVAIGGDVTVHGRVRGDAVAVGGDVRLRGVGIIDGDAVSVGGRIDSPPGTRVGGQNVGLNWAPVGLFRLPHQESAFHFFGLISLLLVALFLLLLGWLLYALAERRMRTSGAYLLTHPWKSLFTGIAVVLLMPAVLLLLAITIVGIPVALLLMVLVPILHVIGLLIVATEAGNRLLSRGSRLEGSWFRSMASGLGLFLGIVLIGGILQSANGILGPFGLAISVFGWTVIFLAATVGLGALTLSRLGRGEVAGLTPPPPPGPTEPVTAMP